MQTKFSTSLQSFTKEVAKLKELRGHPGIAKYFGSCIDEQNPKTLLIVTAPLTPWFRFLELQLAWCAHVHTAITLMSLLDYVQLEWDSRHMAEEAYLHCDLNRAQFAFTKHHEAVLVDYGGLEKYNDFPHEK